jgi:cellulose synthase/poly-beta-1,6-N-acetylglucosamine synthase-like glycosyltransferase
MTGLELFEWSVRGLTFYFLIANLVFLILLVGAFISIRKFVHARPLIESFWKRFTKLGPPISVIAPAFNEEQTIVDSVYSFLTLQYTRFEVLIVNDGSTDQTLSKMKEAFQLEPSHLYYYNELSYSKVHETYISTLYPNLIVIDKQNGGKADAINVGIGFSRFEFFCAVDSDSILDPDALVKVVLPFIEDPERTIASGGTVRPVNGSDVRAGRVIETRLPSSPLVLVQIVEYLRAFLFGRVGWNIFNSTLIISGAFGLFKKQAVVDIHGYQGGSLGEDMELVMRLRYAEGFRREDARIAFIPDPICWTEAPSNLKTLGLQRDRWQRGLAEVLFKYRSMMFNPKFGFAGFVAVPYFFFVEMLGPLIELFAYLLLGLGWWMNWIHIDLVIMLLTADILFGILMSMGAVMIEESAYHKYPRFRDFIVLLFCAIFEQIGFRQLNSYWRVRGTIRYFMGAKEWGPMERKGFSTQ